MKKLFLIIFSVLVATGLLAQNIEKKDDINIVVKGNNYVATFTDYNGGYMQSFVVDGEEFEEQVVTETRGNYLLSPDIKIGKIIKREWQGNKYTLTTEIGTMVYDFYPDKVEISAFGSTQHIGAFFILNPAINSVKDGEEYLPYPLTNGSKTKLFMRKRAGLQIDGDCSYWGPWVNAQVVDISINPGDTKKLILTPVKLSEQDLKISLNDPLDKDINVFSPVDYQVFQRESKAKGTIKLCGLVNKDAKIISYRITGKDLNNKSIDTKWKKFASDKYNSFNKDIPFNAGGWYKLEVKYSINNEEKIYTVDHVGIGEIIIGAGQSNSTNSGQEKTKHTTGFVVNTDGINWRLADDPQIGVHDGSGGGSFYPALGDALYKEFNVPVAVAPTGWGGTNLAQWQPDAYHMTTGNIKANINLYDFFMHRVAQFGKNGFRCVVWHQGESDFWQSANYYYDKLSNVIWQSRKDAGWNIPWFVAMATYCPGAPNGGLSLTVREGQKRLWDNGVAFEGPDTDQWTTKYRDYDGTGIHFSPKGLKKHGETWAEILGKYIHSQID